MPVHSRVSLKATKQSSNKDSQNDGRRGRRLTQLAVYRLVRVYNLLVLEVRLSAYHLSIQPAKAARLLCSQRASRQQWRTAALEVSRADMSRQTGGRTFSGLSCGLAIANRENRYRSCYSCAIHWPFSEASASCVTLEARIVNAALPVQIDLMIMA